MAEYIEHEAAIAVIEEKQKELCPVGMYSRHAVYGSDREKFDAWQEIIETLEAIPAADVRPVVRGKWKPSMRGTKNGPIQGKDEWYGPLFLCSECGADMIGASNFCPNCGADMREES